MLITDAYTGSITISCGSPQKRVYSKTRTAHGSSIGELLDELVSFSVTLANEALLHGVENAASNKGQKDCWSCQIVLPNVLTGYALARGTNVQIAKDIVQAAVEARHSWIESRIALIELECLDHSSDIDLIVKNNPQQQNDYSHIASAESFHDVTNYGYLGKDFDSFDTELSNR